MKTPFQERERDGKKKKSNQPSFTAQATMNAAADEADELGSGALFPIVGVGASAGGLEAFKELLAALPRKTGMGFVLVQHLDPDHDSALTEILSRATSLPVREITNDERVRVDHVYVIPPNTQLTIAEGVLKIQRRQQTKAPLRSIDTFFESLARDQRERAVGVVLSGTANDGTIGLEAIKAEGGITFAQDDSAKHDSMPRSAVAAGCVDLILSPADIAKELVRIASHSYVAGQPLLTSATMPAQTDQVDAEAAGDREEVAGSDNEQNGYKKILQLLRCHSGVDFSLYKPTTIQRRVARRLMLNKQSTLHDYASFLRGNAKELDALFSDVLIHVTSFFRNPETFDVLQHKILPELLKQRGDDPLRFWVLACSTGQEAYSIAMAFVEAAEKAPRMRELKIFATDLNEAMLEKARQGLYPKSLVADITPQRLQRFFVEADGGYRISKTLRDMVVFARQNLTADPPFSRVDLISCRNMLMYLEPSAQKKAMPTFHYALKPGGFLLLGASESIGGFTHLFEPVDKKHKIYFKKPASIQTLHLPVRTEHGEAPPALRTSVPNRRPGGPELPGALAGELNPQREADRITLSQFAPSGVLVNAELQVLQFRGETGAFLEQPAGKPSLDVLKMARNGLMLPLRSAINQATKQNKTARKENVRVKGNGKTRTVTLAVIPLKNLRERCFLILFEEAGKASGGNEPPEPQRARADRSPSGEKNSRIAELETELSGTHEYLQSIQEQLETASEEYQASNEEVQSANEELQSSNEELETSKEELQSTNEELTTVNDEMLIRNVELNRLNSDLVNLQASAEVAIVLLGPDLTIRRFNPHAEKQFDLLLGDVGRSISQIRHNLVRGDTTASPLDLESISAEVISGAREQEDEVRDKAGRWHSLRVRPYMTADAKVDGAVLVLVDVDQLKQSEQANSRLAAIVESSNDAIISTTFGGDITSWNGGAERQFGYSAAEAMGRHISLIVPEELRAEDETVLARLGRGEKLNPFETERQTKDGRRIPVSLNASPIKDATGQIVGVSKASRDISERKRAEHALRESLAQSAADAAALAKLNGLSSRLWQMRSLREGLDEMLGATIDLLGADMGNIQLLDEKRGLLRIEAQRGFEQDFLDFFREVSTEDDSACGRTLRSGERTIIDDVETDAPYAPLRSVARAAGYRAVQSTPLRNRYGAPLGMISTHFRAGHRPSEQELRRLDLYAHQMAGFIERCRADEVLERSRRELEAATTELRASEEQLRQYSAELSDAAIRKNEFLAMLGHELRNPLAAFSHGLDLLGRVSDDRAKAEDLRGMMTRQTTRIVALLDQLLDIARVSSGKVELSKNQVDLADTVRAAVETVQPLLDSQEHKLTVRLPSDKRLLVMGDAVRLTQIVENILTNAAKYTNRGGQIEVTLESDQDTAKITVRDNGIGMSAELLPHVFEVFTQAPRTLDRAKGGMGLGLPLVQRLVEMHGGWVTAESAGPDKGSVFVVTLPCTHQSRSDEQIEGLKRESVPVPPGQVTPRRILVVDDETDTAEMLAELLEEDGHITLAVSDGAAALEAVSSFAPDVVLLDLGLPEMDGYEVARKLREKHEGHRILLIAVTGYQRDDARLKQAGFDDHLIKPPDSRRLTALLAKLDTGKGGAK